jgi:ATP-dependent Lon protease
VLPVGGVRQKVVAAHRAGLTDVVVPRGNAPELDDVAESVREAVRIHLVDDVTDVLAVALAGAGDPPVAARGRDGGAAPGIAGVAA